MTTRIPTPVEGNPFYPLPADYESLSAEGRRSARLNASRQWTLPGSDPERASAAVASLDFFDKYYLWPDEDDDFDPMFYDDVPMRTPDMHWDVVRDWAVNRMNLSILPRGTGKSTLVRKDMIHRLVTRPLMSYVYATSSHDNAKLTGQVCKTQCYTNRRIHDDFASEMGGKLEPSRGEYSTGVEFFYLNNGSWLQVRSAQSKQRGMRPRRYRLDDPEYDPKASTSMSVLRDYVEELLFKIVLPMVTRPGTGADWTATFVSKRHYAWHAMQVRELLHEGRKVLMAEDPRFNFWNRLLVRAAAEDPTGRLVSCWPEMWPSSESEKTRPDQLSLPDIKVMVGPAVWNSEYMASPGTGDEAFFPELGPAHEWWYEAPDALLDTNPRESGTLFCYNDSGGTPQKLSLHDFLRETRLFITMDYSYTEGSDSDYKVATLVAQHPTSNILFVLDMFAARCRPDVLIEKAFAMADLWKVPSIHPEVVKESFALYVSMDQIVKTRLTQEMGHTHIPRIIPIKPGQTQKTDKIASLLLRFEHGLIKLPLFRSGLNPWRELIEQISSFNPEARDGGLAKDDHIDTISMAHLFVAKGRIPRQSLLPTEEPDPVERIAQGEFFDEAGQALGMGIDWSQVPLEKVMEILDRNSAPRPRGKSKV